MRLHSAGLDAVVRYSKKKVSPSAATMPPKQRERHVRVLFGLAGLRGSSAVVDDADVAALLLARNARLLRALHHASKIWRLLAASR